MTNKNAIPAYAGRGAARWLIGASFLAALAAATPAYAEGTAAGTRIVNQAQAVYEVAGEDISEPIESNEVELFVAEVLDVTVEAGADVEVYSPATGEYLTFTVTNTGNGTEAFELAATNPLSGDDFDPTDFTIYIDDGDGDFEPGEGGDEEYNAADAPEIDADDSITVFVVANIPGSLAEDDEGSIVLTAEAETGTGTAGAVVGTGETVGGDEYDIVVGLSGGDDDDTGTYVVVDEPPPPIPATLDLDKSVLEVEDPFGGEAVVSGSVITYEIEAAVTGDEGGLTNLRVSDAIPEGTTYETGSMTLDGDSLTDADDTDEGEYDGDGIVVSLGDVAVGTTHVITFQVEVDTPPED